MVYFVAVPFSVVDSAGIFFCDPQIKFNHKIIVLDLVCQSSPWVRRFVRQTMNHDDFLATKSSRSNRRTHTNALAPCLFLTPPSLLREHFV
jgi:hypothetical protein